MWRIPGGIHLPAQDLWLDPGRSQKLAFISHAHSDHVGRHGATLATPLTLDLMRTRMGRLTAPHLPGRRISFPRLRGLESVRGAGMCGPVPAECRVPLAPAKAHRRDHRLDA